MICMLALCSYDAPCFPGDCSDSINCKCKNGFTGSAGRERCKTCT